MNSHLVQKSWIWQRSSCCWSLWLPFLGELSDLCVTSVLYMITNHWNMFTFAGICLQMFGICLQMAYICLQISGICLQMGGICLQMDGMCLQMNCICLQMNDIYMFTNSYNIYTNEWHVYKWLQYIYTIILCCPCYMPNSNMTSLKRHTR